MFKSEAALFFSAETNLYNAEEKIRACLNLHDQLTIIPDEYPYMYNGISGYWEYFSDNVLTECRRSIDSCGIDKIIELVSKTKENLLKIENHFAEEYYKLTIGEDRIEKLIDSLNDENYNFEKDDVMAIDTLYAMLSSKDEEMLTEEMKVLLDFCKNYKYMYQKLLIEAEINSILKDLENEYKSEEKDEEKINNKEKEFYNKYYDALVAQENYANSIGFKLSEEFYKEKELTKNRKELSYWKERKVSREKHDFTKVQIEEELIRSKQKIRELNPNDVDAAEDYEIEWLEMSRGERAIQTGATVCASTIYTLLDFGESITDGACLLSTYKFVSVLKLFGLEKPAEITKTVIGFDIAGQLYDEAVVESGWINKKIAYSGAHKVTNVVVDSAGQIALQFVPGGTAVTVALHGLRGTGKAAEKAHKDAPNIGYERWAGYAILNGAIEAGSAYVLYGKYKGESLKVVNWIGNAAGFNGVETGCQYVNEVLKPSLITKILVAPTKEGFKEATDCLIGEKFDVSDFVVNAAIATGTVIINETVVVPAANWLTNKKASEAIIKELKQQGETEKIAEDILKNNIETLGENVISQKTTDAFSLPKILKVIHTLNAGDYNSKVAKKLVSKYIDDKFKIKK